MKQLYDKMVAFQDSEEESAFSESNINTNALNELLDTLDTCKKVFENGVAYEQTICTIAPECFEAFMTSERQNQDKLDKTNKQKASSRCICKGCRICSSQYNS